MMFNQIVKQFAQQDGMELSTMMGTPCLRYKGDFVSMYFDKEDSLIVKVSPERVNEIIENGEGNEFNYTKKRFKEWVLIPTEFEETFEGYIAEAIAYVQIKAKG